MTITFNPGPSEIAADTVRDLQEIGASGLLAASHRSDRVRGVVRDTLLGVRRAMRVPDDYTVVFQPSATAAMELAIRNAVQRASFHFVCGAFAERFAKTAEQCGRAATRARSPDFAPAEWDTADPGAAELIAVTHNETSTGQMWPADALRGVRARWPDPLLAVDVTSSFGAMAMDWRTADLWFGSVQKCLGLPAGLAYVLAGPRALERAKALRSKREVAAWQDLEVLARRADAGETVETPNVLAIALLGRRMRHWDLAAVEAATLEKGKRVADAGMRFFVQDPAWRSRTVHNLVVDDPAACHARAEAAGFLLGKGYGDLRDTCIRIATFPAHRVEDLDALLVALRG